MKLALLRALLVFGVFGLYAALAPRQYESDAKVRLADGRTVTVRFRDPNPERAQTGASELAHRALVRPVTGSGTPDQPASQADEALAKFVTEHPEPPAPAPVPASSVSKQQRDTERVRLEIERNRIQAELDHGRAAAQHGDNPFEDQVPEAAARQLRLRLEEVNRLLRQRATAAEQAEAPATSADTVATTLLRLVDDAVRAAPPPPVATQMPVILEEARLPLAPIEPRIALLFALGGVAGVLSGLLPLLFRSPRELSGFDEPVLELAGYGAQVPSLLPAPMASASPLPSPLPPALLAPTHAPARRASSGPPGAAASPGADLVAYPLPWNAALPATEALSTLLAQLRSLATQDCFVVAVSSSAQAADARSRVVARLAAACARADQLLALVVDADLARPLLHRVLGSDLPAETELTRQLEGRLEGANKPWSVLELAPSLHALLAEHRAPELALSRHFEACIKGLRPFYDIIILHAPPLSEVPQCRAIDDLVDGVILVRRPGEADGDGGPTPPFTAKRFATNIPAAWADDSR